MAKIRVQLWEPHRHTDGERLRIHEEPHVTDTKGKKKSRLRGRRRNKEQDQMATTDKRPGDVFVSKVNWKGRRERGDPY